MKTEELKALGIEGETATRILAINGKDVENAKREMATLTAQRDDLQTRLTAAEEAVKKFGGKTPEEVQQQIQEYQQRAQQAEKDFRGKLLRRDQEDWIKAQMDRLGVGSPYARKQLETEILSDTDGLKWKDGAFLGFEDFMKAAKTKDPGLYLSDEEKKKAEEEAQASGRAPKFTGPMGDPAPDKKFTPPKIF